MLNRVLIHNSFRNFLHFSNVCDILNLLSWRVTNMTCYEVKDMREKYNISQSKLAKIADVHPALISAWELNKKEPTEIEVEKIASAVNIAIQHISNDPHGFYKKRIQKNQNVPKTIPKTINSKKEYNDQLVKSNRTHKNAFGEELTQLYYLVQKEKTQNAPRGIALFSGCGGMSLGFEAAGVNLIGHVEIEETANIIYNANFPNSRLLGTDVINIDDENMNSWLNTFGEIDFIIGGPPCQGFSLAGKRNPNDERNKLYHHYAKIIAGIQPKVFVMENVRLLTSMKMDDNSLYIDNITSTFSELGYSVTKAEINACNYGVPQDRNRLILVGVKNNVNNREFIFPEKTHKEQQSQYDFFSASKNILTFRQATDDLEYLESGEKSTDPLHWSVTHPHHVIEWLKDVPEGRSAHENEDVSKRPLSGFNTTYKRLIMDEPSSTISTNFSMISGCRNVHPTATRSLTIREATRIQTFPDEFIFLGNWGGIRKAIGNAVPPLLAKAIGDAIMTQLF